MSINSEQILAKLSQLYDINFKNIEDLRNGTNLMNMVNKLLYSGKDQTLLEKINNSQTNNNKAGNNAININTMLKQIKQDIQIMKNAPIDIKQITFFNILEDQSKLLLFLNWVLEKAELIQKKKSQQNMEQDQLNSLSSNRFKNIQISLDKKSKIYYHEEEKIEEEPYEELNDGGCLGLQNLYFASNINQKSLSPGKHTIQQQGQKIVRKGSFKLLKPKVNFNEQINEGLKQLDLNQPKKKYIQDLSPFSLMNQSQKNLNVEPDELKEISMIQQSNYCNLSSLEIMNSSNIYIQDDQNLNHPQRNSNISHLQKFITTTPIPKHDVEETRKTIPKNLAKPPLYRNSSSDKNQKNKQNINKKFEMNETVDRTRKQKTFFDQSSNIIEKDNDDIMNEYVSSFSGCKDFSKLKKVNSSKKTQQFIKQNINNQLKEYFEDNIENNQIINQSKHIYMKNKYLKNQIQNIDNQISKQSSELQAFNKINYQTAPVYQKYTNEVSLNRIKKDNPEKNQSNLKASQKKSTRKVLKINLNALDQAQKHQIIQWLVRISILTTEQINNGMDQIQDHFRNGVKFIQLCNYYIRRSKQLPCFSNPKKNAEIHSNYSKIFQYLKSITYFQCQLIFAYELFVPQPYENAIWNLLSSMFKTFYKKNKNKSYENQLIDKKESSIKRSISKSIMKNNQSGFKNLDSSLTDRNETNKKTAKSLTRSRTSSSKGKFQTPIQFVREIPEQMKHKDLIQNIQPQVFDNGKQNYQENIHQKNIFIEGYKGRYYRKTMSSMNLFNNSSIQTPKKVILNNIDYSLIMNNPAKDQFKKLKMQSSKKAVKRSLKKSESSASKYFMNSNQKVLKKQMPKVTLNMQMKVLKWLNKLNLSENQDQKIRQQNLLTDPIRNGSLYIVLLSLDPAKHNQIPHRYFANPKSIDNCRQNYLYGLSLIKSKYGQNQIFQTYYPFIEQIIKGEKCLFYGLAYSLLEIYTQKGIKIQNNQSSMIFIHNIDNRHKSNLTLEKEKLKNITQSFQTNHIDWVRYLETINPEIAQLKIRDQQTLNQTISSGHFIYYLCRMIINHGDNLTLVYPSPINLIQKQLNLNKLFTHLYLNKILIKDQFKGIEKQLAQKNTHIIDFIINILIPFTVDVQTSQKYVKNHQNLVTSANMAKSVTLSKYIEQENLANGRSKRLQTTADELDNFHYPLRIEESQQSLTSELQIQIAWMRKLGYTNCSLSLKNGVILCRLISKLTRNNIIINQNLTSTHQLSKPDSLLNIRKALKLLPGSKWDELDIYEADQKKTYQVYNFIKDKFKHTYEMTRVLSPK